MKRFLSNSELCRLKAHLKCGGLVAYATESCFGLGCLPFHAKALKRIMYLKKRPQGKGMIVIGSSLPQLLPLLDKPSEKTSVLLQQTWPAPVTFLLDAATGTHPLLRGRNRGRLAVRVPAHDGARAICKMLGFPLVSTSCNRAGKRPCKTAKEAARQFGREVWIINGRIGKQKTPSRIIDVATGRQLR